MATIIIVFLSFNAAGKKCVVYDAVFHPDTYSKGQEVWILSMKRKKNCYWTCRVSFLDFEGGKFGEMSASSNNLFSVNGLFVQEISSQVALLSRK